jgi:uncharacterized protein YbbK (DUF523 family)
VSEPETPQTPAVLVSACLLGVCCRYDGTSREHPRLFAELHAHRIVPICPEQMGGLPTPRSPCEIKNGCGADVLEGRSPVVDDNGQDQTAHFIRGAEECVRLARAFDATRAVMKARSPSCDARRGVAAALLAKEGLSVENADD